MYTTAPAPINEMNKVHPASPKIGAGTISGFLFFIHRDVIKMLIRDAVMAVDENVRIFELKTMSLFI